MVQEYKVSKVVCSMINYTYPYFLTLQSLASAIAATNVLSAKQVVKNEAGEEVMYCTSILV